MTKFLTCTQVSKKLGTSRQTINVWIRAGRFPNAQRLGSGDYIIPEDDLDNMVELRIEELEEQVRTISEVIARLKATVA